MSENSKIITGTFTEEQEIKMFKEGLCKMWQCTCPHCKEVHRATTFHDAIVGIDWHKKDCHFITKGVYTKFTAYPVYVN